jgi:regulator of sigma E protease
MDLLQTILALIVTLGILVTVHELGHFLVARRFGVRVLRFSVGMGPALWRRTAASGTEYMIAALPIGGYVKMLDEREGEVPDAIRHEAFTAKPPLQRIAIALGGPLANFLLAIAVYWLVFVTGVSGFAPLLGTVDPDTPAGRAGVPDHAEIVAIDDRETATWQAVNGALVDRLGETGAVRIATRQPGTSEVETHEVRIDRWLAGADEPDLLGALGLAPSFPAILGEVVEDSAAEAAGLRPGDRIVAVDGEPVDGWRDWVARVQAAPGRELTLTIDRGGLELLRQIVPATRTVEGADAIGFVGTGPMYRTSTLGVLEALPRAVQETWDKTTMTLGILKKMLEGLVSTRNLSGPITIAKVAGDSAESGMEAFLSFLALLSVSLGVLNLLPIPVLDGGHVLFYLVELLKGSPVPERVQILGVQVGIFIVASLMLLAFYNDLSRL